MQQQLKEARDSDKVAFMRGQNLVIRNKLEHLQTTHPGTDRTPTCQVSIWVEYFTPRHSSPTLSPTTTCQETEQYFVAARPQRKKGQPKEIKSR